ncbi:aldehyde dehydrogenase family protein [Ensifer sp. YR511]|uniref:aldehyde dehydrogenase family protein n=1 Tax=Ensifer sp. YR511 TaxID=1855294 RepID=UPI000885F567|nr:aldehyde dehydrogenase family protein [Ensifer sp. YR511]SDN03454.1 aldehyde dehydrogenase (NAD+) [Ensifer sp. YR511]
MLQKSQLIEKTDFYINGGWQAVPGRERIAVINPANEEPYAVISAGTADDIDRAVVAARAAFDTWSLTSRAERLAALERIAAIYAARMEEMAQAISREMGAPIRLARDAQAQVGLSHLNAFIDAFKAHEFETVPNERYPNQRVVHEPIGVCGLITPWNWPMNQISLKVLPAIAVGCTVVLKPSEIAPMSAMLFAEFVHEAGIPAGVFNLVNGEGTVVGEALSNHPDIDMMSFTGSTRAGIAVSRAAAATVKRVSLELGGKSPNIVFADSDLSAAIQRGVAQCFENSGQSCNSPTRMLIERHVYDEAIAYARAAAASISVGDPALDGDHIGPVVSALQYSKIQGLIEKGVEEGARLIAGGPGRPEGFDRGYFVRPTIFADVDSDMAIAREEIFGPVLALIPFDTEEEAIRIANDTPYGLSGYIQTGDPARAGRVARRIRAGMIQINGTSRAPGTPFGGYKQSGNGREGGKWGLEDFLEVKLVSG